MNNNRCIICNEIIPEGRDMCLLCENAQMKMGAILQSLNATKEETKLAYDFMEGNNDN